MVLKVADCVDSVDGADGVDGAISHTKSFCKVI